MFCGKCQNELHECTCPDIKERLASLKDSPYLSFKWCQKCDNHYSQCKCDNPEFIITGQKPIPDKHN